MSDQSKKLQQQILQAISDKSSLIITGSSSKNALSLNLQQTKKQLLTTNHNGIIDYQPSELVITVRSGTPLAEINETITQNQQYLSFEPPLYNQNCTVGGMIASGFSGSRRPWSGLPRDCLLGCKIINGRGEMVTFGGQVFKNVAGFDLFRPQAGAWGTLGVILQVSLRLNPQPKYSQYITLECSLQQGIQLMNQWQQKPYPITGLCWYDKQLYVRLEGFQSAIENTLKKLKQSYNIKNDSETLESFWQPLNSQKHPIFQHEFYRLFCPPALFDNLEENTINQPFLVDWGGALRYYHSQPDNAFHYEHWSKKQGLKRSPLQKELKQLQQNIRHSFDPHNLFNQHIQFS